VVSIVIPVLDEERCLRGCLDAVVSQTESHRAELLVVDGGSGDATVAIARSYPAVRVIHSPRGRGRQMNEGARQACGSLLLFLPGDTQLPPGSLAALETIDRAGHPVAGGFGQRFDRDGLALRTISALHNLRARLTGIIYGDQVPFVRSELFGELGGFREDQAMEDLEFGERLRRQTRPRLLGSVATTSARRFESAGVWRATAVAALLLASWTLLRRVPASRTFFSPVR